MIYQILHKTEYNYAEPASLCYSEARLLPRPAQLFQLTQTCLSTSISIEPPHTDYSERVDYFGNVVIYYTIRQPHTQTVITSRSEVKVEPNSFAGEMLLQSRDAQLPWEEVRTRLMTDKMPTTLEARQFIIDSPLISVFPELTAYAAPSFYANRPVIEATNDLMQRIYRDFEFEAGVTTITTPLAEVLQKRRGVCQDFAHLMVGCLRSQGLAARYVSGYIETLPPPGQEKLHGADASHAWCSVFVPQLGWVDFDPTNNLILSDQHIVLGWGRDFSDVTPLKGVFLCTGKHRIKVAVDVRRLD
jgi:transglutaminase-like putative cysteine protease